MLRRNITPPPFTWLREDVKFLAATCSNNQLWHDQSCCYSTMEFEFILCSFPKCYYFYFYYTSIPNLCSAIAPVNPNSNTTSYNQIESFTYHIILDHSRFTKKNFWPYLSSSGSLTLKVIVNQLQCSFRNRYYHFLFDFL